MSLFARMALILFLGLLGTQAISLWLHWGERATVLTQTRGQNLVDRVAEIVRVLEAEAPEHRATALAALRFGDLRVTPIAAGQVAAHAARGPLTAAIAARLGSDREVRSQGMGSGMGAGAGMGRKHGGDGPRNAAAARLLDVRLADGQWIRIASSGEAGTPPLPLDYFVYLTLSLLAVGGIVLLAVRQTTRPLQQLAEAADAFGRSLDAPALAETGPTETRQAAQAFNRMQGRIRRLVDERARALAAVSHDLRTPLTRLRLRTELVTDDMLRDQMAADLDAMSTMIDATLDYLRSLRDTETPQRIDMVALLDSMAEDARVLGNDVIFINEGPLPPYHGRLSALQRAVQNLLDNAVNYGERARLRLEDSEHDLQVIVDDEGPGIPGEQLDRVTDPYYRIEGSRSRDTGGIGLGLSIVTDVARLHGGRLELSNLPGKGLRARLILARQNIA